MPKLELHKWLDKTLKPVLAAAKKGSLSVQEQLEVIDPILVRLGDGALVRMELLLCYRAVCLIACT